MGPKKNKQEKAAKRRAKNSARKSKQNGETVDEEFDDDVPKMKIQLEKLGLELKEVEGDG